MNVTTVNIHLGDETLIESRIGLLEWPEERYAVLHIGSATIFPTSQHLQEIIAACETALDGLGNPAATEQERVL